MNIEEFREFCLSLSNTEECTPFDDVTLVFKVLLPNGKGKMFALIPIDRPEWVALKCDPELAIVLRERYANSIEGAYHLNKVHWNGVIIQDSELNDLQIKAMVLHSYELVSLSKGKHRDSSDRLNQFFEI